MKNIIILTIIYSLFLMGCNSSKYLVQINKKYRENEKPISQWNNDLLKTRTKVFEQLNMNGYSGNMYLIEKYNIENCYYSGLLYLDETKYFHFCRESLGSEIKIINKKLTNTENFIVAELNKGVLNNIKEKSKNTDVISPCSLYITIIQKRLIHKIEFFRFQEFYID